MFKGKITDKRTASGLPNGHKVQRWHEGKNQSFHVPDERVEEFTEAIENYRLFSELIDQYVQLCEQEVLRPSAESSDGSKKKPTRR